MVMAGVMALGIAIYASNKLWAQAPASTATAVKTRVGLLNLTYVIKNYSKFKNFQEELKKTMEPFQAKDSGLKAEGDKIAKDAQTPNATAEKREQIERKLKDIQRAIEDNKVEAQKVLMKKNEEQLKIVYMDVRSVVDRYAQAHGFEMVLHYNDAVTQEEYWSPQNILRKMQAGALMPMYIANGLDISANIVSTLNSSAGASPAPAR
ncbi:MAG: OmpH family outer membrane protein [Gemmataceae bacterium]